MFMYRVSIKSPSALNVNIFASNGHICADIDQVQARFDHLTQKQQNHLTALQ